MNWLFLVFVIVAAFLFAKIEIEIEGQHGWAENLPTWRIEDHFLLDWFFGGRSLTGYHTWTFVFVLVLVPPAVLLGRRSPRDRALDYFVSSRCTPSMFRSKCSS
jgi:hypothetical protein